jgi:adenylate cyclase
MTSRMRTTPGLAVSDAASPDSAGGTPEAASVRARVGARVQRSLRSRTVTWMTVGFATILVMTAIALGAFVYQQRGIDAVRHTVAVDGRLARVLSAVQDAETGQRGYLLTGDKAFLRPFTEGRVNADRQLELLRELVQDDADQGVQLDILSGLIREKLDELGASIARSRQGDGAAARASVAQGRGKQVMDAIRDLVRRMEVREADRMERRQAMVSRIALVIWVMVGALAILFVLFAVSALREATRRNRLSRVLPPELALRLADGDGSLKAGRRQQAAIVFVDMRGSTTLAENLDPHRLSEFLSASITARWSAGSSARNPAPSSPCWATPSTSPPAWSRRPRPTACRSSSPRRPGAPRTHPRRRGARSAASPCAAGGSRCPTTPMRRRPGHAPGRDGDSPSRGLRATA